MSSQKPTLVKTEYLPYAHTDIITEKSDNSLYFHAAHALPCLSTKPERNRFSQVSSMNHTTSVIPNDLPIKLNGSRTRYSYNDLYQWAFFGPGTVESVETFGAGITEAWSFTTGKTCSTYS